MLKVIICRGIPASGKTTWARNFCEKNPDYFRVNRDDIRKMLNQHYSVSNEFLVKKIEKSIIVNILTQGYNVIVDDTNLSKEAISLIDLAVEDYTDYSGLGEFRNVSIEYKDFFDVSLGECVKRDSERVNSVGENVIKIMYDKLLKLKENNENSTTKF